MSLQPHVPQLINDVVPEPETALDNLLNSVGDIAALSGAATDELLQRLIPLGRELYLHGKPRRILLGRLGRVIHDLAAKPGYGNFTHIVEVEIGIPINTMRDYMAEATAAEAGSRTYETRTDELGDTHTDGLPPHEAGGDSLGDQHAESVDKAIKQAKEESQNAETAQAPTKTLRIVLDVSKHKTAHEILENETLRKRLRATDLNETAFEAFQFTFKKLVTEEDGNGNN